MIVLLCILLGIYATALTWFVWGAHRVRPFSEVSPTEQLRFTIIIPFRNEAAHLPQLLASLKALDYPHEEFEILFVNDASTDASEEIIETQLQKTQLHYHILQNQRYSASPKKDAITEAVKKAKHPWIATTDADCEVPEKWLQMIHQFWHSEKPKMICSPVRVHHGNTLAQQFQFWDGLSLQLATLGGFGWKKPLLCNGANLAFEKDCFFEVNGYEGNNHLATGDDVFLLEKIQSFYPQGVHYLRNAQATVVTNPVEGFPEIVAQRIRWASKTSQLKSPWIKVLAFGIFLGNFMVVLAFLGFFIHPLQLTDFLLLLLVKFLMDLFALTLAARLFKERYSLGGLLANIVIYPFLQSWIFIHSWKGSYRWKGRSFKK